MCLESHPPESVRPRYALKLLGVSLLIVLVITALTTVTVFQVSDRVRDNQLQSVETNAEHNLRKLTKFSQDQRTTFRGLYAVTASHQTNRSVISVYLPTDELLKSKGDSEKDDGEHKPPKAIECPCKSEDVENVR